MAADDGWGGAGLQEVWSVEKRESTGDPSLPPYPTRFACAKSRRRRPLFPCLLGRREVRGTAEGNEIGGMGEGIASQGYAASLLAGARAAAPSTDKPKKALDGQRPNQPAIERLSLQVRQIKRSAG